MNLINNLYYIHKYKNIRYEGGFLAEVLCDKNIIHKYYIHFIFQKYDLLFVSTIIIT